MFLLFSRWRAIFTWWHKHFFPSQRNFHSSDSGSLVIDCLARWAPFTKSKCWIYLPILLYSKCRACKLVLVIRNANLNLRRYFLILFYNQLLPPDTTLLLQQWSPRPSTTAEATLGSHRRYIKFPPKVSPPPTPHNWNMSPHNFHLIPPPLPGLTATALLVAGGKVALGALQVSSEIMIYKDDNSSSGRNRLFLK